MRLRSLAAALIAATAVVFASMAAPAAAAAGPPTDRGGLQPNVVGGSPAPAYSFMGSLQDLGGNHFCGATVVHPNWAVTARHCVLGSSPASMRLRVGSNNRTSGGALVAVTSVATHPTNDLAMIGLGTVPAAYLPVAIAASSGPVGTFTRIMGWGQTCPSPGGCGAPIQLQQLNTSIVADGSCAGIVSATEICTSNPGRGCVLWRLRRPAGQNGRRRVAVDRRHQPFRRRFQLCGQPVDLRRCAGIASVDSGRDRSAALNARRIPTLFA